MAEIIQELQVKEDCKAWKKGVKLWGFESEGKWWAPVHSEDVTQEVIWKSM